MATIAITTLATILRQMTAICPELYHATRALDGPLKGPPRQED
jgi:hypothetical protein